MQRSLKVQIQDRGLAADCIDLGRIVELAKYLQVPK